MYQIQYSKTSNLHIYSLDSKSLLSIKVSRATWTVNKMFVILLTRMVGQKKVVFINPETKKFDLIIIDICGIGLVQSLCIQIFIDGFFNDY